MGKLRANTPTIYNVTLTNANTEYSQVLPAGTEKFAMQPRTAVDVRWAHVTGKVATPTAPYMTMKGGAGLSMSDADPASLTVYLASGTAGTVVEIIAWSS